MISPQTVTVGLDERSYDIHIGEDVIDQAGTHIGPLLGRPFAAIITDENVDKAQGQRLYTSLKQAGVRFSKIVLPAGEATKSFTHLQSIIDQLLNAEVDRGDMIIALGGGVIGDLVGFAAAIIRRGCRFVQIPTSLLAQVDSAVGGKTAINVPQGKNLVGAFHQPSLVLADISALDTLSPRELRAGYAEVVKYGALGNRDFFDWLEKHGSSIIKGNRANRIEAVKVSVQMKADIVARDEKERGDRALLNLGHTFGHALEAEYGYDGRLLHGEAIAAGMVMAFAYSEQRGLCPADDHTRLKAHLRQIGLPADMTDLPGGHDLGGDTLFSHMMQDKKVEAGGLALILARQIGDAFIERRTDQTALKAFLQRLTSATAAG